MSYTAPIYTIPAGERLEIPGEGKFVRVLEASDWFDLGLDDAPLHFIEQGLAVESPGFRKVVLRNPQSGPITVRLGVASGVIHDSRFSVPNTMPVQVENFPAPVVVADADKTGVVSVGAHKFQKTNAWADTWHEMIDPAQNVNGVMIRVYSQTTQANWGVLAFATAEPNDVYAENADFREIFQNTTHNRLTNIYLKPGLGVYARQLTHTIYASITYDILP